MHPALSPDIILVVLAFLDWRSIVRSTLVCRTFYSTIHSSILQYRIELGAAGLKDTQVFPDSDSNSVLLAGNHGDTDTDDPTTPVPVPISTRLTRLRQHLLAWRTLSPARSVPVHIPDLNNLVAYEFVQGIFAAIVIKNVVDHSNRPLALVVTTLPGSTANEPTNLVHDNLDANYIDFAIDPSQDLLIFTKQSPQNVTLSVHIHTLSSNKNHPRASSSILKLTLDDDESFVGAGFGMRLCADVVAVYVHSTSSAMVEGYLLRVIIWKWTSGELLFSTTYPSEHTYGVSLISPSSLMITTNSQNGAIELYRFRRSKSKSPKSCTNAHGSGKPRPTARLLLPALSNGASYANMHTHTGTFTSSPTNPLSPWQAIEGKRGSRIHVMNVVVSSSRPDRPPLSFMVTVANSVLCRYAKRARSRPERGSSTTGGSSDSSGVTVPRKSVKEIREVLWQEWGPMHTRWLEGGVSNDWLRYVHGARFAQLIEAWSPSHQRHSVRVLDFGVHLGPESMRTLPSDMVTTDETPRRLPDAGQNNISKPIATSHQPQYHDSSVTHHLPRSSGPEVTIHYIPSSEPTTFRDPHYFREAVESRLPYLETTMHCPEHETGTDGTQVFRYSAVMIDEERLVGVSVSVFNWAYSWRYSLA